MKRFMILIGLLAILVLLAACNPTPTAEATLQPQPTLLPTETPLVSNTPLPTVEATKESDVVGPPEPTTEPSTVIEAEIFCPTANEEAQQAYNDAISLRDQGQDEQVEKLYLRAIELDPGYCDAMDNLGQLLRTQGRLVEAIEWYSKSLAIYPENIVAYTNLGVAYLRQSKWDDAIAAYTKVTEISPLDPEGYYGLGRVYYEMEDYAVAIPQFIRAEGIYSVTNSPYLIDAQYYLGLCHFGLNDYVPAREYFLKIYDMATNDGAMNYILGICYLRGEPKNLEMAGQFFLKAQALDIVIPDDVLAEMENAQP